MTDGKGKAKPKVVLASSSPRRIEFVQKLGIQDIAVIPPGIEETLPEGLSPEETVRGLALEKAKAVAAAVAPDTPVIIAADTMVYLGDTPLGKPADAAQAAAMLKMLSARRHTVYTGIAVMEGGRHITDVERTEVFFRELSDNEIDGYVATGEPMDKAGAYALQDGAAVFVSRIEGDFWNVAGLPLCRLSLMLKEFGV